ncbi:MAG: c-type cytochrome, partial [Rhodospirillaceae bacterium]|nr:c-type cytochrome [Rhodospirillaceae bacterium]
MKLTWPALFAAALAGSAHAQPATDMRAAAARAPVDLVAELYRRECAVCHGDTLRGGAQGTPLVGAPLRHGDSVAALTASTANGLPERGMPAWAGVLSDAQIHALALYISEQRAGTSITDFRYAAPLRIPDGVIASERHAFTVQTVAAGLDPLPYGLAVLPDGRFLVTEKMRGLKLISADG